MIIATRDRLHCLTDELWAQIEDFFPRARKGFPQKISNRAVFEAVIYRARVGCPWRDLPTEYGCWHAIYMRWTRWVVAGVPAKAMARLHAQKEAKGELSPLLALLDSTIVRAHQHATGALKKRGPQAMGRSRGGLRTKIHTAAISDKQVLEIVLTPGQANDAPVGQELAARIVEIESVDTISADKAYDSDAIRHAIEKAGKEAVIPPRSNRLKPASYDKEKYKERNQVERLFNRLKQFWAVATRYDSSKPCS